MRFTHAHPSPWTWALPFLAALPAGQASAGPVNPDISVIGDAFLVWSDPSEDDQPVLEFHELELAFVGPLNPYASAEAYLGIHGTEGIEVEEAKLILDRYFPGGFGATIGQFLLDFGQLNTIHLHAYPWVHRPLMHEEFFGEDGLRDMGARLDWIAPTDGVTLRASAGAVRGDVLLGGHHHHDDAGSEPDPEHAPEIGGTGRVELFAEPSDSFSFLVGASALRGVFDPEEDGKATWIDVDAKARFDLGPYRALVLNGETVLGSLDETAEAPERSPDGFFAAADLRASRRWNVGGFVEATSAIEDDDATVMRWGGFVGLGLMEETTMFRVVGSLTDPDAGDDVTEVLVQALFALGPHRPHRY